MHGTQARSRLRPPFRPDTCGRYNGQVMSRSRTRRIAKWMGLSLSVPIVAAWLFTLYGWAIYRTSTVAIYLGGKGVAYVPRLRSLEPPGLTVDNNAFPPFWFRASGFEPSFVPLWIPLLIIAIPTVWFWRRDWRPRPGHCPNCRYDLRGLTGDVVTCPECGTRCDVAAMLSRRWRKPWAPGYHLLLRPMAWLLLFGALGALASNTFLLAVVIGMGVVTWGLQLRRCGGMLPDCKGIVLSLALQGILLGSLVVGGALPGAIFLTVIQDPWWILALPGVAALAIGCLIAERRVAEICVRHYLNGTLHLNREDRESAE